MKLIGDPKLLIVLCIVENCIIDKLFLQFIDNFHFIEVDHRSIRCTAGNVCDNIRLDTDAHLDKLLHEWNSEMNSGFG